VIQTGEKERQDHFFSLWADI